MSVSSTSRFISYIGNGLASQFAFAFKVFTPADLSLVETSTTGAETNLALTTDYTVALNVDQENNPGGTVTLTAGPLATGASLFITSDVLAVQLTSLPNGGGFYPSVITDALDRLTMIAQQLQVQINTCLQLPIAEAALAGVLPPATQRVGMVLGFDATTGGIKPVASITVAPSYGTATVPYSATPALNASQGSKLKITLTGNASPTFASGGAAGAFFSVQVIQDGTGGHTFTWPANMKNMGVVNAASNSVSEQLCSLDSDGTARALGPIMYS